LREAASLYNGGMGNRGLTDTRLDFIFWRVSGLLLFVGLIAYLLISPTEREFVASIGAATMLAAYVVHGPRDDKHKSRFVILAVGTRAEE
jgi:hypothetical protein